MYGNEHEDDDNTRRENTSKIATSRCVAITHIAHDPVISGGAQPWRRSSSRGHTWRPNGHCKTDREELKFTLTDVENREM